MNEHLHEKDLPVSIKTILNCSTLLFLACISFSSVAEGETIPFLKTFGKLGRCDAQFRGPYSVAVSLNGSVYIADTWNNRIQKFDRHGVFEKKWDTGIRPFIVAVDTTGFVYVAGINTIEKYTGDGVYISGWGGAGTSDGKFTEILFMAISPNNTIYAYDQQDYTHRIQKFNTNGVFTGFLATQYGLNTKDLQIPWAMAFSDDGSMYVLDINNEGDYSKCIKIYDRNGVFVNKIGKSGAAEEDFYSPTSIAVDSDGSCWILDPSRNTVQCYNFSGNFQGIFGTTGTGNAMFNHPRGIAISSDKDLYVADTLNDRIQIFSPSNFVPLNLLLSLSRGWQIKLGS